MSAAPSFAQQAAPVVELPPIEVTTPSPIAKPARKRPAPGPAPATAPATSAPPPGEPELQLPGTLIVSDDAFVAVTVATEREIESRPGATITDTLQTRPGIIGSTFAPGANRPIVRGLDNYRVRVQEDGIGTHDVSAMSEDHAVPVDPLSAGRIEVVRGPATLRYGSAAIGGVVSVENERVPTAIPSGGVSAVAKGGWTSVDRGRDGAFSATAGADGIVVRADGFARHSEDYDTPRGRQENSFVDSEGFSLGASRVWSGGYFGLALTRIDSIYGIPGIESAEEQARIDLSQTKVLSRGEWQVRDRGIETVRLWLGASDYAHDEIVNEGGGDEVGSRFTNREQEARLEVQHLPVATSLGELRGAAGVHLDHRNTRGTSFEGDSLLEPASTDSLAAFWFEELQLTERLRVQAATRLEHARVDGVGLADAADPLDPILFDGARRFTPASASLGVLYELPMGVVARLTGQYVERAPDAAELFSKGVHEATETFEIGNPFLEKETARTIELGFKRAKEAFRFDAAAYYTKFDGFIFKQLTGVKCGDTLDTCGDADPTNDELDQLLFEQRNATFHGAELAVQYDVAPVWQGVWGIDAQYDFVRARLDGGENVPRIPPHRIGAGLYYRDASWFARIGALHAFRQDEIGVNETPTPGYTLLNAELSYTQQLSSGSGAAPEITVGIRGDNLLDDEVRNHASFKKDEVLLPGASVRLFGSVKLN